MLTQHKPELTDLVTNKNLHLEHAFTDSPTFAKYYQEVH